MKLITDASACPKGWQLTTVGEACEIHDELRVPINVTTREAMQGPYPYYGPTGIVDHINEYRIDGKYALIGEDGDHFLKYDRWPMTQLVEGRFNVNNHAHIVRGRDGCLTEWFYLYFHHMRLKPVLTLQGVGRYKLTQAALQGLPIPLPPLEEQQRITCIIRHWTKAVERLDLLVRAKEQLRTGRIQRLLNGKWRLKRFMSQHWTPRLFGSFLTESRISGSDGASARKITVRLYGKGICRKEELRQGSEETQYYTRRAGQLIYSKLDFLNGAFAIVPASLDGYETTLDLPAFDIDTTTMDARWLLYYLTQKRFYTRHLGLAHGGRKARRVNQGAFLGIVEPIPSKDEQTAIADLLSAADCEIEQLRQLLDAIKRQKRGLMQKLLTGQIPVKV